VILRAPILLLLAAATAHCQLLDPAYDTLARAYEALRAKAYDDAISNFQKAIQLAPERAAIHKDLAYAYLKIGENELARDQFREAMEIEPADTQAAMEYAFLAYETRQQAEARRVFDRLRRTGDPIAERAFQNIDRPLAEGIARWQNAIAVGANDFSAHFELATLAEQRDELPLAAEHYALAWRILPDRRSVLVDLGRVWKALGRAEEATAALLAASRGGEPRAAEMARELLPNRYPYVPEFQAALELDPANVELRRELAYLLLRMDRQSEAEREFGILTEQAPGDLLAATQLGFLRYARGEQDPAMLLFERVLAGNDEDLANRVRAVLRRPQLVEAQADLPPSSLDARTMAERSIQAGFINDALKYLAIAHDADPGDFRIMLQLGWTYNMLHQDAQAIRWFDLARRSPDPQIAAEAGRAWNNLHSSTLLLRTTAWLYPLFSTRWHDFFSYGQIKTELRAGSLLRPYASIRFIGDTRQTEAPSGPAVAPEYLSENSFILGGGIRTVPRHGITAWFEAGSAISYISGHVLPDYRGGLSALWHKLPEEAGWFGDTSLDAVFMSRFNNDFLACDQSRFGYAVSRHVQLYWNANFTLDARHQYWANFFETGPGVRLSSRRLPPSMWISGNLLRGAYLVNTANPRGPNFTDARIGIWYAFTTH